MPGVWPWLVIEVPSYVGPALLYDEHPTYLLFGAIEERGCDEHNFACRGRGINWAIKYAANHYKVQGEQFGPAAPVKRYTAYLGDRAVDGPPGDAHGGLYMQLSRMTDDACWAIGKAVPYGYWDKHNKSYHARRVREFDARVARLSTATCARPELARYFGDDAYYDLLVRYDQARAAPVDGSAPRREAGPHGGT